MIKALARIDWRVFSILLAGGLLGVLAILPYVADLVRSLPVGAAPVPQIPLPLLVAATLLQNGILLAVTILIGMIVSERIGLRMPLIKAWATGEPAPDPRAVVLPGALLGAAAGAILVAADALLFVRQLPAAMQSLFATPLWKRLLAGIVYGGITEELFMRLFLLSVLAWLIGLLWKTADGKPTAGAFRTAIVLTAVLFGLGHLPVTAALAPLTQAIVARAVLLNGIAGIAFGYLYWRHGLEAAMVGHMSAHLVMQLPGVMLLERLL